MDLRRLLTILRTWSPLLVITALVAGGVAYGLSTIAPKVYEARAMLIVGALSDSTPDYTELLAAQRLAQTYEDIATTGPLLEGVRERLDLDTPADQLARRIRADAPSESVLLTINASAADPEEAAAIANALADGLLGLAPGQLNVIEPAVEPDVPISPRPLINTVLAVLVGLLVAGGIVFVAEYLNDSLKNSDDVREVLGLPTLGGIMRMRGGDRGRPEMYRLVTLVFPRSPVAEAYRTLRANIEFTSIDAPIRSLLVTSSVPREGKTVTGANLAIAFAQTGRRVLLVDADLRKPGAHHLFNVENLHGLTTLFRVDNVPLDAIVQPTEQQGLHLLTTGSVPPNPAELLASRRMRTIVERLQAAYELVIVDGPPVQVVADSAILSSFLDGTLFVVDSVRTRRGIVRQSREALAQADARVVGVVLNRLRERAYSDYHHYGMAETDDSWEATVEPRPGAPTITNRSAS